MQCNLHSLSPSSSVGAHRRVQLSKVGSWTCSWLCRAARRLWRRVTSMSACHSLLRVWRFKGRMVQCNSTLPGTYAARFSVADVCSARLSAHCCSNSCVGVPTKQWLVPVSRYSHMDIHSTHWRSIAMHALTHFPAHTTLHTQTSQHQNHIPSLAMQFQPQQTWVQVRTPGSASGTCLV